MATITAVTANREEACPGDVVTFTAIIDDPSETVGKWEATGGQFQASDNTLTLTVGSGASGSASATATLSGQSVTKAIQVFGADVEIEAGPVNGFYAISAEPKMPVIPVKALGIGAAASSATWNVTATWNSDDCPPYGTTDFTTKFVYPQSGTGTVHTIEFGDVIRGNSISVEAEVDVANCIPSSSDSIEVLGTNPPISEIRNALPHEALRAIACRESGLRQFEAPADGGIGRCPLMGPEQRVGIMQLEGPTDDQIWNWRENVAGGIAVFNEKVQEAAAYADQVRNSPGFQHLVDDFNAERLQQGFPEIAVTLPPFSSGNFDDDLQQLERDAIRGYNGWFGVDAFGFPLHEYKVATDQINGKERLRVSNINSVALTGLAEWEPVPVEERPVTGDGNVPNYVNEVLSLVPGCAPGPNFNPAPCPKTVAISVDNSDTKTHKIASKVIGPPAEGITDIHEHFVTVKGTGDIILKATINPDNPAIRNLINWETGGATITSPAIGADRTTAKISRDVTFGEKIVVRFKIGKHVCKEIIVWIIWCVLAGDIDPQTASTLAPGVMLGKTSGNAARSTGEYAPNAAIEWTAVIFPVEIITDIDRPALENQKRVDPPGGTALRDGVPGRGDSQGFVPKERKDRTGSVFSAWDMSRQVRAMKFVGNILKLETISQAPNSISYPNGDDPVVGNDDDGPSDEDDNPYDQGAPIDPTFGDRGILGEMRSFDRPQRSLQDVEDYNGIQPGEEGDEVHWIIHFREFARVQLGDTWYRCSDFGLWRWHMHAIHQNGEWNAIPNVSDILELNNDNFAFP